MIHNKYIFGRIKSKNTLRSYIYIGERKKKKKYNRLRQGYTEFTCVFVVARMYWKGQLMTKLQHHTLRTFISHRSQVRVNASIYLDVSRLHEILLFLSQ